MNLLLPSVLLLTDKPSGETFKKIEELIEKSTTTSVKHRCVLG
jgi:hypothetical protein